MPEPSKPSIPPPTVREGTSQPPSKIPSLTPSKAPSIPPPLPAAASASRLSSSAAEDALRDEIAVLHKRIQELTAENEGLRELTESRLGIVTDPMLEVDDRYNPYIRALRHLTRARLMLRKILRRDVANDLKKEIERLLNA